MKPLTRVDVTRHGVHNAFVRALLHAGFEFEVTPSRVYLVRGFSR